MLMLMQLLAPGVEHGQASDLSAQMRGVSGDVVERLGDRAKEQAIELAGVLKRQGCEVVREGKDHMAIGGIEDLLLPSGKPRGLGRAVTFGTTAVTARVIRLRFVSTVVARDRLREPIF